MLASFEANRLAHMHTLEVTDRFSKIFVIPIIGNADIDTVVLLSDFYGWDGLAVYPTINALLDGAGALVDLRAYEADFGRDIFGNQ